MPTVAEYVYRVTQATAQQHQLPDLLGLLNLRSFSPVPAICLTVSLDDAFNVAMTPCILYSFQCSSSLDVIKASLEIDRQWSPLGC
jgi:hypothetical protein